MNPLISMLNGIGIGMILCGLLFFFPVTYAIRQWARGRRDRLQRNDLLLDAAFSVIGILPSVLVLRTTKFSMVRWRDLEAPDQLLIIFCVAIGIAMLAFGRIHAERFLEYRDFYHEERERFRKRWRSE